MVHKIMGSKIILSSSIELIPFIVLALENVELYGKSPLWIQPSWTFLDQVFGFGMCQKEKSFYLKLFGAIPYS